jgi:outer membrane protein assembly factor BamE
MFQTAPGTPLRQLPRRRNLLLACVALLAASLGASGCVYRMVVQQGNFLDGRQVSQVQVGMTRGQVRFLLGTPMLPDAFDRDRWDYLYTLDAPRTKDNTRQRLTIFFTEDKVARIENVGAPTTPAPGTTAAEPPVSVPAPAPAAPPSDPR